MQRRGRHRGRHLHHGGPIDPRGDEHGPRWLHRDALDPDHQHVQHRDRVQRRRVQPLRQGLPVHLWGPPRQPLRRPPPRLRVQRPAAYLDSLRRSADRPQDGRPIQRAGVPDQRLPHRAEHKPDDASSHGERRPAREQPAGHVLRGWHRERRVAGRQQRRLLGAAPDPRADLGAAALGGGYRRQHRAGLRRQPRRDWPPGLRPAIACRGRPVVHARAGPDDGVRGRAGGGRLAPLPRRRLPLLGDGRADPARAQRRRGGVPHRGADQERHSQPRRALPRRRRARARRHDPAHDDQHGLLDQRRQPSLALRQHVPLAAGGGGRHGPHRDERRRHGGRPGHRLVFFWDLRRHLGLLRVEHDRQRGVGNAAQPPPRPRPRSPRARPFRWMGRS